MADDNLDDVLSIFDDEPADKKAEEQPEKQAETPAPATPAQAKTAAAAKPGPHPGMTPKAGLRPGFTPKTGATAPKASPSAKTVAVEAPAHVPKPAAPIVPAAPKTSTAVQAPVARHGNGGSALLIVLLVLNVVLLLLSVLSFTKAGRLEKQLNAQQSEIVKLVKRSELATGLMYGGANARPQCYIMQLDFKTQPGQVKFGKYITKPAEE